MVQEGLRKVAVFMDDQHVLHKRSAICTHSERLPSGLLPLTTCPGRGSYVACCATSLLCSRPRA